jgi:hypothetical protein
MSNNLLPHSQQNNLQNRENPKENQTALGDLRQDKRRSQPPRSGTSQPAAVTEPQRAEGLHTKNTPSPPVSVHKHNKEKLTLWVDPIDIEKLRLKATKLEVSMSSVGAEALHKALHHEADIDYTITLKPLIEATIDRRMAARDNRLALLLVRNYLVGEQNRGLTTYLVGRVPDLTPDIFNDILDHTFQEAKKKLVRRSPELEELIKEVKRWVIEIDTQREKQQRQQGKEKP